MFRFQISNEVEAATSRLQATRRDEWKSRKKASAAYRLTCENLSSNGTTTNNNNSSIVRDGSNDTVDSATLLLRKRTLQSPPTTSTRSPFKTVMRSASLRRVATLSTTHPIMEISSSSVRLTDNHSALSAKVWFFDIPCGPFEE